MTTLDELRRNLEAGLGNLTPARAQELAKGFLEPGAAKDQVAKTAADLMAWSHRNRERLMEVIRGEVQAQLRQMGGVTQDELDALKKRVRTLERQAGMTASGRRSAAKRQGSAKASSSKRSGAAAPAGS